MDAVTIKFKANGQQLTRVGSDKFAANTVSYIRAEFELGDNWDGWDSVRAVWATDFAKVATVLDNDGACTVPWEVLNRTGTLYVNLVGSISDGDELTDRLTTYKAKALDVNGCTNVEGTETAPLTPSQFEQFVAIVEQLVGSVKDIDRCVLNADYTLTIYYSDGTSDTVGPIRGEQGATGPAGNGISSIAKIGSTGTNPVIDTYRITYTNGTHTDFTVTNGLKGDTGATGNGIESVYLTATHGAVKTYTILFTDGTTYDFNVTDGEVTNAVLKQVLPTDTASGAIASFPDGSDLFDYLSCVVDIEPVQAGSGTPSPDNVRPITGWTGCEVDVCGVNLFDGTLEQGTFTNSGVESASNTRIRTDYVKVAQGDVTISTPTANTYIHEVYSYDKNKNFVTRLSSGISASSGTVTVPSGAEYIRFSIRYSNNANITPNDGVKAQVELGSTASPYTDHTGATYPVSWQTEAGTVYGGTVDVVTGVLTVEWVYYKFDGTENWQTNASKTYMYLTGLENSISNNDTTQISNMFVGAGNSYATFGNYRVQTNGAITVGNNENNTPHWALPSDFENFLTQKNLEVCYKIETPQTYNLTPTQIACLLGQNNVWADCGDVDEVKYKADVQLYIEKMLNS